MKMQWCARTVVLGWAVLAVQARPAGIVEKLTSKQVQKQLEGRAHLLLSLQDADCLQPAGSCDTFFPELDRLAVAFGEILHPRMVVATANHTQLSKKIRKKLPEVNTFPSIVLFVSGTQQPIAYDHSANEGGLHAELILKWAAKHADMEGTAMLEGRKELVNVVELTQKTWSQVMDPGKHVLVEFYLPRCAACTKLERDLEAVAATFVGQNVTIARLNGEVYEKLARSIIGDGYPQILLWTQQQKEEPVRYSDKQKDAGSLVTWLNKECGTTQRLEAAEDRQQRMATLERLVASFMTAIAEDQEVQHSIVAEVAALLADAKSSSGYTSTTYFHKVMQRVLQHGAAHVSSEKARLQAMLVDKEMSITKLNNFHTRVHILDVFGRHIAE